ncbi:helix-turn-helix domain-containing protein [Pseudomonas caricapapayae]|uniref:helix-turn-helix domain-containing protein n=1 Tax=Pseudomonas caricapapayae TaxID=46678 RepID=UPI000F004669|nr:XRE family transcriptional regulator [Pseudomonas caricapapayae]
MSLQLKILRKRMGITLESLAETTGLTKSYLSKVERGLNSPSIAVALKLAKALHVQAEELFSTEPVPEVGYSLVRRTMWERKQELGAPAHIPLAQHLGQRDLLPFMVYPPRSFTDSIFKEHFGEEFVFVHSGRVEVDFGAEVLTLEQGDALHFGGYKAHRIRTVSEEQAQILVVVYSPPPSMA